MCDGGKPYHKHETGDPEYHPFVAPDQTTEGRVAKARERAERPCVWSEGEVPRHVAEYLWDAVHDRHALLAYIDTLVIKAAKEASDE